MTSSKPQTQPEVIIRRSPVAMVVCCLVGLVVGAGLGPVFLSTTQGQEDAADEQPMTAEAQQTEADGEAVQDRAAPGDPAAARQLALEDDEIQTPLFRYLNNRLLEDDTLTDEEINEAQMSIAEADEVYQRYKKDARNAVRNFNEGITSNHGATGHAAIEFLERERGEGVTDEVRRLEELRRQPGEPIRVKVIE